MPSMLTWEENGRFALGDATFLTMPSHDAFSRKGNTSLREGEFFLFSRGRSWNATSP